MIIVENKNTFEDLLGLEIETEDKFLNKKLNSHVCYSGGGGGGQKQQDIAPTLRPYVTDVLSRAKGTFASDQPYQAYPGERVVGFTPQELAAQQGIQQMAGQYGLASMAPGLTSSAAYYNPAYSYLGQTGQALGQQAGALGEAPRLFGTQEALYGEALRPITGIQQQLTGAERLLGESAMRQREAAREIGRDEVGRFGLTSEDIQQYMDPYQQAVVDIEKAQARQDALQTAQAIAAKSAGAGAFGGSRQAILESQAASDLGKRLSDIQTRGSQAAYQQALQTAAQQQQVGLGEAAAQRAREQQLGSGIAGLAGARQQLGVGGYGSMAEQLRQAGAGFGGLGGQYGQLAGQYGQLGGGLGALSGQYGALGQQALGQGYRELGYLSGVGESQRGLGQQRADVAYGDFLEQREFPASQLERYASMAFGVPSQYMRQIQQQPSGFQQAVSGITGAASIGKNLGFFNQGGDIGKGGLSTVYREPGGSIRGPGPLSSFTLEDLKKYLDETRFDSEERKKELESQKGQAVAEALAGVSQSVIQADPNLGIMGLIGAASSGALPALQKRSDIEQQIKGVPKEQRKAYIEDYLTISALEKEAAEKDYKKAQADAEDVGEILPATAFDDVRNNVLDLYGAKVTIDKAGNEEFVALDGKALDPNTARRIALDVAEASKVAELFYQEDPTTFYGQTLNFVTTNLGPNRKKP